MPAFLPMGDTMDSSKRSRPMATQTKSRRKSKRQNLPSGMMQVVRVVKADQDPKLELRKRLDMTREAFGRLVNVSVRAIAAAERNQKDVAKL
jgi:hypothetical protein